MLCEPVETRREEDRVFWRCRRCGFADRAHESHFPHLIQRRCDLEADGKPRPLGAGGHLKKLLFAFGLAAEGDCECDGHAREMDLRGPDWCAENIDVIVGWLREAAERRGVIFVEFAARQLVRLAIRRARADARRSEALKAENGARSVNPMSDPKTIFARVYCVNLARRADRWRQFQARLPADWPFARVQKFRAIDGQKCPAPDWWRQGGGAWGCYHSHLAILEKCLNEGVESVLILEDDAVFPADFSARAAEFLRALPDDWGLIYFGGQHLFAERRPPLRINEHVYRPYNVNRTHAFALRGPMLGKVYRHLLRRDWRRGHHIDHHLGRLHQRRADPIYSPREWLVGQAEGRSNISRKNLPERFWPAASALGAAASAGEPFVAIVGLHASGSSLLAGVCHRLGLHLGNQLTGHHDVAGDGHRGYEAIGLAQLCERAIPFPACELRVQRGRAWAELRRWIVEKQREARRKETFAAGKYPMLCRLAPQLLNICGEGLRVLHIDRPLEESIASLVRRCPGRDPAALEAHQRWLWEGKLELLDQAADALTVAYADLLADPEREARRVADWLELEIDAERIESAAAIVDPSRRHVGEASA